MADMLDLFHECRDRGLNVHALKGFTTWQQNYWFRREGEWSGSGRQSNPPNCFINHHTATPERSGYMPNVHNSKKQSKANIWLGIQRSPSSARLYQSGSGDPAAYFAVRWAANYGNGACDRTVYERYVWRNLVAPNQPSGGDDGYANKHAIGMEIVHEGTGAPMDAGVFELAAQLNAAAMHVFGWDIARILDHRSSTRRKRDLDQAQKLNGYTINALRARVVEITAGGSKPPVPPPEEVEVFLPLTKGMGMGDLSAKGADVVQAQRLLNKLAVVTPGISNDGKYGDATVAAVRQAFPNQNGREINGNMFFTLQEWAFGGDGGGSAPHSHTFNGITGTAG